MIKQFVAGFTIAVFNSFLVPVAQADSSDYLRRCSEDCYAVYETTLEMCAALPIEWQYDCSVGSETTLNECLANCRQAKILIDISNDRARFGAGTATLPAERTHLPSDPRFP